MKECFNKYCSHEVDDDTVFCGKCTPPYDDISKSIDSIENENEKLGDKIEWCDEHNMGWQASLYRQIYSHTRKIITKLKYELLP